MLVIRPVNLDDLMPIEDLARQTGFGLTTLPRDINFLRRRIRNSMRGFAKLTDEDPPRGETYLFVMEDMDTAKVVGTCAINSKVGGFDPFYGFEIVTDVRESATLNVRREISVLRLDANHNGPCEIGSLFLSPEYRRDGNGRLLSLSRFLFMAEFTPYFDPIIIAELRGVVDEMGYSPFWEAVGRHFFDVDFPTADYLSMVDKRFIADLLPKDPIYIPLLPHSAQAVIGKVHEQTEPALKMLTDEGFEFCKMVDIFDAGPVVRCPLSGIRTIRQSKRATIVELTDDVISCPTMLIANTRHDFRAVRATLLRRSDHGIQLNAAVASALRVKVGDSVRFVTPRVTV